MKITVLTPTHNRAKLLMKLYDSIKNQNYKDLEWVIVDDGSIDNTKQIVDEMINRIELDIKYIYKENGGKPSAHNEGIKHSDSDLTIICDDDDYLSENAMQYIIKYWNKYSNNKIGGMIGFRGINDKTPLANSKFPNKCTGKLCDIFKNNNFFDTTQIYKTEILKQNLFPVTKKEKFVPEVWLWKQLDKQYDLIFIPHVLEICKYRDDGLTKTGGQNMWNNPMGYSYYFEQAYEESKGISRVKYYGVYKALRCINKQKYINESILIKVCSFPIYCYVYLKYKWKNSSKI